MNLEFLLRRLSDYKRPGKPKSLPLPGQSMLRPASASFTGGGTILVELPTDLQESLRSSSKQPRFCLVFEGAARRHVSSCALIANSHVIASIPEHQERSESLEALLYQRQGAAYEVVQRHRFHFEAPDPLDLLAAAFVQLSVRLDADFPIGWAALTAAVDATRPPPAPDASTEEAAEPRGTRLIAQIDSLGAQRDTRLAKSLERACRAEEASVGFERVREACKKAPQRLAGRSTVLHFLAREGLLASTCCLLRHARAHRAWAVPDIAGHTPADLADRAGFTEFSLLLRCPKSMEKWLDSSAEAQQRSTSGDSVASVTHSNERHVVLTTNKEKSQMSIQQDILIHEAVETSEIEGETNALRMLALNGGVAEAAAPPSGMQPEDLERLTLEMSVPAPGFEDAGAAAEETISEDVKLVHNTDTVDYGNFLAADHPPGSPFVLRSELPAVGPPEAVGQLGCTAEDLKDVEQSWSSRLTRESRQSFTRNFIKRQDLIWELVATERNYVKLLQAVHEVYEERFLRDLVPVTGPDPVVFTPKMAERLFPCVRRLAILHGRFLHRLCEQQLQREDRSVIELGDLLLEQFEGEAGNELVEVYGEFYARHRQGKTLVEELGRASPRFRAYLTKCEGHPAIQRRKLADCYLIINQRFSKVESLLVTIAENTINQEEEANKLNRALGSLKDVTFRAEAMLGATQNREMQEQVLESFDARSTTGHALDRTYSREDLDARHRKVLHFGKLKVVRSGVCLNSKAGLTGSKPCPQDCVGLLFPDMLVLLQEMPGTEPGARRFAFLKEDGPAPSILPFGSMRSCIFRESPQRQATDFEFYVIFVLKNMSFRYSLYTSLGDDRAKWVKLLTETYMDTESKTADDLDQAFDDRRSDIQKRYDSGREVLSQMAFTDWEIDRLVNIKAALWQRYLSVWDLSDLEAAALAGPLGLEAEAAVAVAAAAAGGGGRGGGGEGMAAAAAASPRLEERESASPEAEDDDETDAAELGPADFSLPDIEGLMKRFAQEATKLHMLIHSCSSNLTRSASSAADQAGRGQASGRGRGAVGAGPLAGAMPRRVETFAGYDKHNNQDRTNAGLYGDKRPSLEAAGSEESVSFGERPMSAKSESTLKVKKRPTSVLTSSFRHKAHMGVVLRHPEGHKKQAHRAVTLRHPEGHKKKDSSRRRSSLNFSNLPNILRSLGKTSSSSPADKEHSSRSSAASLSRNASAPLSPLSTVDSAAVGPASPASPADSAAGIRCSTPGSSWSNDTINWPEVVPGGAVGQAPNRQAVLSLTYMNAQTRKMIAGLSRLRTQLLALHNRSLRAEREAATLREQLHSREAAGPSCPPLLPTPSAESLPPAASSVHVMTEKLRNQRAELDREKADFQKWRTQQRAKLESEREQLERRKAGLEDEVAALEGRKRRQEEKEVNLQAYARRLNVKIDASLDPQTLLFPEASLHGRTVSEENKASGPRRDSLGSAERRHANPAPAQSLLSLSQGGMRTGPASKSFSDLPAASQQPPVSPPAPPPQAAATATATTPSAVHLLPMNLAEGDKPKPKGKTKRASFFRQKKA